MVAPREVVTQSNFQVASPVAPVAVLVATIGVKVDPFISVTSSKVIFSPVFFDADDGLELMSWYAQLDNHKHV